MPSVLVPLAKGAEEIEAVVIVDVLRRAGINVVVAGVTGDGPVTCSRGVVIQPDEALDALIAERGGVAAVAEAFNAIALPGGAAGAKTLASHAGVQALLKAFESQGRWVCAICAAPIALAAAGVGSGRSLTSHPSVRDEVARHGNHDDRSRVVRDGKIITSRAPGTAIEFALAIVEALTNAETAAAVAEPMALPQHAAVPVAAAD